MRLAPLLAFLLLGSLAAEVPAQPAARLPDGVRRVVFLGDSITYAGGYVAVIETYFVARRPEQAVEFINVGLPSETVSGLSEPGHAGGQFPRPDLHERLRRVLTQTKPDLVFACYGMNDGIYLPFDAARFRAFQEGQHWLHREVEQTGARIIHVTPPVFDGAKSDNAFYNDVLGRYSAWLLEQRAHGWQVADVHGPMTRYLNERRRIEPDFALAADGVHPGELGHALIAQQILAFLGGHDVAGATDADLMAAIHPHGAELLERMREREELLRDAWLSKTGHQRPGIQPGLPLDDARARAAEIGRSIQQLVTAPAPLPADASNTPQAP
jgi:lysophospholipase L1-like esterase